MADPDYKNTYRPENAIHVFIDIETMSTSVSAPVWEIGAIILDSALLEQIRFGVVSLELFREQNPNNVFETGINVNNSAWKADTRSWAEKQPGMMARFNEYQIRENDYPGIYGALLRLNNCIAEYIIGLDRNPIDMNVFAYSWGNFDIPILQYWYERFGVNAPWSYNTEVNVKAIAIDLWQRGVTTRLIRPNTIAHNAVFDAYELMHAFQKISNTNNY